jgi:hypothetical protein
MNKNTSLAEVILILVGVVTLLIFMPFISYWTSYFGGWLASIVIGETLCNSLNLTFNTIRFTPDQLPQIAGALGWVGSFFKGTIKIKEESKNKIKW